MIHENKCTPTVLEATAVSYNYCTGILRISSCGPLFFSVDSPKRLSVGY